MLPQSQGLSESAQKPRIVLEHILHIHLRSNFYGDKLKVSHQVSCHLSRPCSWMDWYASEGQWTYVFYCSCPKAV